MVGLKEDNGKECKMIDFRLIREKVLTYVCVLIPLIGFVLFSLVPMIISFVMQFTKMEGFDLATMQWNFFENFLFVFTDKTFYLSIGVTLVLALSQLISLCIALFVSVAISKKPYGYKTFQVIFFVPYICSSVAVSLMWMWMFDADTGIINTVLQGIFGASARVNWFGDKNAYPWMIIIATCWQAPGYGIVMFKAALGQVEPSLYEASGIDGANGRQQFFHITLPSIAPVTFYLLMTGIIAGLQLFDMPKLFGEESWLGTMGPENSGLTTVLYIYNTYYNFGELPRASVMSWLLFAIIFLISFINMKLKNKWVDE